MRRFFRSDRTRLLALAILCLPTLVAAGCGTRAAPGTPAPSPSTFSAPTISFPDLTSGPVQTTAKLWKFDSKALSAVVEPVVFMTGFDFCKKYAVDATDARCHDEWLTVDSHRKISMPLSPSVTLTSVRGGAPECIGSMNGGGTCPIKLEQFAALLPDGPMLVAVTARDGTVTRIAQEYTP